MVQIKAIGALVALPALASAASNGLNTAAKAAGLKYFGSATDNGEITDASYAAFLSNTSTFGQITPGNSMKWGPTEPEQGTYDYTQGDEIASFAEKNGQLIRCHNLVWHQQYPSFIDSTTWTNETLIQAITDHITSEVTHYKGQCYAWDVVNEPLNDDGTYVNWTVYNIIGPAYIPIALQAAAAADPSAKLYINDYNIGYGGAKQQGYLDIVKSVQAQGIKIDGIGLESHYGVGTVPSASSLQAIMDSFGALGVETAVTELDIRETLPSTAAQDAQQALDYVSVVQACLQAASCVGTTVWDWLDEYSWVPGTFPGQGSADLFNGTSAPYTAKPAYYSVLSLLNAHATKPATTTVATTTSMSTTTTTPAKTTTTTTVATTKATTTTTTVKTTMSTKTTTKTTSPTPTSTAVAQHWGQCGGQGWTGPTKCAAPYTCKYSNPYYSQCL